MNKNTMTTEFSRWMEDVDLDGRDDVYSLYQSVKGCEQYGRFTTNLSGNTESRWAVTSDCCEEQLLLASEKARDWLLTLLVKVHCGDMEDMEAWYACETACAKAMNRP